MRNSWHENPVPTKPGEDSVHSACVLDGILDALLLDLGVSPGGEFILESVEWRKIDSVPAAYGATAREAVGELFRSNERDRLGLSGDEHAV
jgi:hypothetical protein